MFAFSESKYFISKTYLFPYHFLQLNFSISYFHKTYLIGIVIDLDEVVFACYFDELVFQCPVVPSFVVKSSKQQKHNDYILG